MLKHIWINGLFGIYDHDLRLWPTDNITILHGPNGSGKTTILKMINALKNKQFSIFSNTPFTTFGAEFDEFTIYVERSKEDTVTVRSDKPSHEPFIVYGKNLDNIEISFRSNRRLRDRGAERIGNGLWRLHGNIYDQKEICDLFGLQYYVQQEIPEWYESIIEDINIMYIGAERLIHSTDHTRQVMKYPDKLKEIFSNYLSLYALTSQQLDASFPKRLISAVKPTQQLIKSSEIVEYLSKLNNTRARLQEKGILSNKMLKENAIDLDLKAQEFDGNQVLKDVLTLYIEDNFKKLNVLDDFLKKIDLFETLINPYFVNKKITVNGDFGYKVESTKGKLAGELIKPSMLSSGEQHFLVLFFELVFNSKNNQLVLIDEPEISLHIEWQLSTVDNFKKISNMNNISFILATHSPSIMRNHLDSVVATGYEEVE